MCFYSTTPGPGSGTTPPSWWDEIVTRPCASHTARTVELSISAGPPRVCGEGREDLRSTARRVNRDFIGERSTARFTVNCSPRAGGHERIEPIERVRCAHVARARKLENEPVRGAFVAARLCPSQAMTDVDGLSPRAQNLRDHQMCSRAARVSCREISKTYADIIHAGIARGVPRPRL